VVDHRTAGIIRHLAAIQEGNAVLRMKLMSAFMILMLTGVQRGSAVMLSVMRIQWLLGVQTGSAGMLSVMRIQMPLSVQTGSAGMLGVMRI